MADASAFDDAEFLGLSRHSKRDPYKLGLLAQHLEDGEHARVLLAVQGGTLVVTNRRLVEYRVHLEIHGAWNVKEFQGYEVRRQFPRSAVRDIDHSVRSTPHAAATVEDVVTLLFADATEDVVVSRGPEPTLSSEDFEALRAAVLAQPK